MVVYDKYYKAENLFGEPYPELIAFFSSYPGRGKILDLGCGQGRDAIVLARLGFEVSGIDNSKVGIEQMNQIAKTEKLSLKGIVSAIYKLNNFADYDFVLLDSMFHFEKKDLKKETEFVKKIISNIKNGCLVIFCIQDTGKKVEILNQTIDFKKSYERIAEKSFKYVYEDTESKHQSTTNYKMIVIKK